MEGVKLMATRLDPTLGFTLPDNTTQSTAAYAGFDAAQSWVSYAVGTDRLVGTTYYNSTGKPIAVNLAGPTGRGSSTTVTVNGVPIAYYYQDSIGGNVEMMGIFLIPIDGEYAVLGSAPSYWYELR